MYRPINWKPRLFATRWTLFGTKRSPTVESQRRICTEKHSGIYVLLTSCISVISFPSESWLPLTKGFLSSISNTGSSAVGFKAFILSLHYVPSFLPSPLIHLTSILPCPHISPVHKDQKRSPLIPSKPPLPFCLSFHPSPCLSLIPSCSDRLRSD